MRIALSFALLLGACVQTNTADCGQDVVCREGTVCHPITIGETTTTECVSEDQLDKCKDMPDGMPCTGGTCYSEACLPAGCGNGRMDEGETCDDGNVTLGDGCSSSCVAEVCGNGVVDPVSTSSGTPLPNEQCDDGNTLGHDGCASTCIPEVPRWRRLPGVPQDRAFASMAVDVVAKKSIMFGGFSPLVFIGPNQSDSFATTDGVPFTGTPIGETWELSETGWNRIDSLFQPSPRGGAAMVNDGTRTLLVGGTSSTSSAFNDVWQLKDGAWTELARLPMAMGPRAGAAMAYWPEQHGVVLFGGVTKEGKPVDDTWFLADGSDTWTPFPLPTGTKTPESRMTATLTYDPSEHRLILAGGTQDAVAPAPLASWGLGANGWEPLAGGSPQANLEPYAYGATAAYDPAVGVVVFGGFYSGARTGDVWVWKSNKWTKLAASTEPRFGATGDADPITGHLQIFGGAIAPATDGCSGIVCTNALPPVGDGPPLDVLELDGSNWIPRNILVVAPTLSRHGYAYDFDRARVVVYGGDAASQTISNRTYEVVDHTWFAPALTNDAMSVTPPVVVSPSLVYATFGAVRGTYMFGGSTSQTSVSPTQEFLRLDHAPGVLTWRTATAAAKPSARAGAAMVFDSDRKRIVLFGGHDGTAPLADTWEYNGTTWTKVAVVGDSPLGRNDAAAGYDPVHHQMLVWGGSGANISGTSSQTTYGDLWAYDGATRTWTKADTSFGPSPRPGARFAWDARRRRMVLWGGNDSAIWEWNGSAWEYVPAFETPTPQSFAMMVQSADGSILVHGGAGAGLVSGDGNALGFETLELVRESPTLTTYATCNSKFLDEDHDGLCGCDDPDCWVYCTPWCPPTGTLSTDQVACDMAEAKCGDDMCQEPRENCGICPHDCGDCP